MDFFFKKVGSGSNLRPINSCQAIFVRPESFHQLKNIRGSQTIFVHYLATVILPPSNIHISTHSITIPKDSYISHSRPLSHF